VADPVLVHKISKGHSGLFFKVSAKCCRSQVNLRGNMIHIRFSIKVGIDIFIDRGHSDLIIQKKFDAGIAVVQYYKFF
jgi:hypothetical protein